MTTITDHTAIDDGTEVTLTLATGEVTITATGDLVDAGATGGGVTGVALFSALEDIQKTKTDSHKYRPKFYQGVGDLGTMLDLRGGAAITSGDMKFIRNSGVRMRSGYAGNSTVTFEYAGLKHGGTIDSAEQCYFKRASDTTPQNFSYTGAFDEPVLIYTNGGTDDTGGTLQVFCRTQGRTYGYYELTSEQSLTEILPVSYLIPFDTAVDLKGSDTGGAIRSDAYIAANAPYTGMGPTGDGTDLYQLIAGTGFTAWANSTTYAANAVVSDGGRWYITALGGTSSGTGVGDDVGVTDWSAYSGERSVDGTYYAFNYVIDGNSGTKEQIWEFHQYHLRNTSNIASGETQRGDLKTALLSWEGDTLVTATGVYVDNHLTAEQSEYAFTDVGGTRRTIAAVNSVSVTGLVNDGTNRRLQIYNVSTATMVYDGVPSGTSYSSTYTEGVGYTAGNTVTVAFAEANGGTSFKYDKQTVIVGTTGFTVALSLTSDPVYASNALNGSTYVDRFTADTSGSEIELNADTDFTAAQAFAFYCYTLTTSAGMAAFWGGVTAVDSANYRINTAVLDLYFNETVGAFVKQTDNARIFRDDGARPARDPTTGGYGLEVNWKNPVYTVATGSALSSEQNAKLMGLPSASAVRSEVDSNSTQLAATVKLLKNKVTTDPTLSKMTVYDDDGTTPLYEADLYDDVDGSTPWTGDAAINRRDALT